MIILADMNFQPLSDYRTLDYISKSSEIVEFAHYLPWADTKENARKGLDPSMKFAVGDDIPQPSKKNMGKSKTTYEELCDKINSQKGYPDKWYPLDQGAEEYFNRLKTLNVVIIKTRDHATINSTRQSRKMDLPNRPCA